MPISKALAR